MERDMRERTGVQRHRCRRGSGLGSVREVGLRPGLGPVKKVSEFTLGAGAKELQRILIGTEFGLQVGLLTIAFGGLMYGSTVLLADDPFWSSPLFPQ